MSLPIHLVGSIPLQDSAEVFAVVSESIGDYVHAIPDGETGPRSSWVLWQKGVFENCPQLEVLDLPSEYTGRQVKFGLKEGVSASEVEFPNLGYADVALDSYKDFSSTKAKGLIKPGTKFMVALPTPLAALFAFFRPDLISELEATYERAMLNEVKRIAENIPAAELAFQWDVAIEFMIMEKPEVPIHFRDRFKEICGRLARLTDSIPADICAGLHWCYGDSGHRHFAQPKDAQLMVDTWNEVSSNVKRRIDWIHMPVPRDRTDKDFFRPFEQLWLGPETRLYLGLIHLTDGVEGAAARYAAASKYLDGFGVATECGFGRRDPSTILDLLDLHAEIVRSVH